MSKRKKPLVRVKPKKQPLTWLQEKGFKTANYEITRGPRKGTEVLIHKWPSERIEASASLARHRIVRKVILKAPNKTVTRKRLVTTKTQAGPQSKERSSVKTEVNTTITPHEERFSRKPAWNVKIVTQFRNSEKFHTPTELRIAEQGWTPETGSFTKPLKHVTPQQYKLLLKK